MRLLCYLAALLSLSFNVALADPIFTTSPLPPIALASGATFYGNIEEFSFSPADGDTPILRMHGFEGVKLAGLPSFLREVPMSDGRLLRGAPQKGTYVVEAYEDGVHVPTLDMTMRFTPR